MEIKNNNRLRPFRPRDLKNGNSTRNRVANPSHAGQAGHTDEVAAIAVDHARQRTVERRDRAADIDVEDVLHVVPRRLSRR